MISDTFAADALALFGDEPTDAQKTLVERIDVIQQTSPPQGVMHLTVIPLPSTDSIADLETLADGFKDRIDYVAAKDYSNTEPAGLDRAKVLLVDGSQFPTALGLTAWVNAYGLTTKTFVVVFVKPL
jgi:hypothetical protein